MWYVYVLQCSDDHIYIGCTADVNERIRRHQSGDVPATKHRLPVQLITFIAFAEKHKAFEFERYLKGGSGRAFISRHFVKHRIT